MGLGGLNNVDLLTEESFDDDGVLANFKFSTGIYSLRYLLYKMRFVNINILFSKRINSSLSFNLQL